MKERNLLYFMTAVSFTTLMIYALLVRSFIWFPSYGHIIVPAFRYLLIPFILIWVGWYFEDKLLLVSVSVLLAMLFGYHLDGRAILNGTPFIPGIYAPIVRTTYVLTAMLLFGTSGLGIATHLLTKKKCNHKHKESE